MKMEIERARRLVREHTVCVNPEQREQIAQRMVETGECTWHAAAMVAGTKCYCADCHPGALR